MEIHGTLASEFESLRAPFEDALRLSHGRGCALSIRQSGVEVVNLWGGFSREGQEWSENTPSIIYSCTKGLLTIMVGQLVASEKLDLDSPVAKYWPEFGQAGKSQITVRQALSHKAGLSALRQDLELDQVLDWEFMVDALAKADPLFPVGSAHQYHALTFGWLIGEILRRVTGKSLGTLFQEKIAQPLGVEAWIGAPEDAIARAAIHYQSPDNPIQPSEDDLFWSGDKIYELRAMTLGNAFKGSLAEPGKGFNDPKVMGAELGGAGGLATASALSKIWSATVSDRESTRLLNNQVIQDMSIVQSSGMPQIAMPAPFPKWGSGFLKRSETREFLADNSFGHDGYGGQVTFADPSHEIGFAFITNDIQTANDERANNLVRALRGIVQRQI